ncbi:MAG: 3-hydroxyacyl-CoA dehydrogenase family protein [Eubacteriales bacterium]|nr:3-hydroxyacyl-CoA dehydrogenase family protein [Eubacteriales bacterium]
MKDKEIAVIGSGTMGMAIAQLILFKGYRVITLTIEPIETGSKKMEELLNASVNKNKITTSEKDMYFAQYRITNDPEKLSECYMAIEAIVEDLDEKIKCFQMLDKICKDETIICTNTSSLSVTKLASITNRADKIIGLHFFNPVISTKMVEIVTGLRVSEETILECIEFVKSLDREFIVVQDTPGFLVNYLQYAFRLNAIRMVERGIAKPSDIDKAAKLALGHPMGPFELQDMVGLDITYNAVSSIFEETKDLTFAPPVLLKRMVEAGYLGKKSGRGFYDYSK